MESFDYESIPPGYYDNIFKLKKGIQSAWHNLKFEFINSLVPPGALHLDVGCGPGTFIGNFRAGLISYGIDISARQIAYARSIYNENNHLFFVADKTFFFNDKTFDVITLIEVIEHLNAEQIEVLLLECNRCLKPSGKLIISTPNYNSLWPVLEFLVNKLSRVSYECQHISKLNFSILERLLKANGFVITKGGSYFLFSPFLALFSWKLANYIFALESMVIRSTNMGFISYAVCERSK